MIFNVYLNTCIGKWTISNFVRLIQIFNFIGKIRKSYGSSSVIHAQLINIKNKLKIIFMYGVFGSSIFGLFLN